MMELEREPGAEGARWPIAYAVAAAIAFSMLLVTGTDISVWQDFRRDVVVRDSYRLDEIADIRFFDSSPYSIWLGSDLFVWRSVRAGTLPLWDPGQGGGYSPLVNVQNGVMHPVRWAAAAVPFEFVPGFIIVVELLLLAMGTHLMLVRAWGLAPGAAACGALTLAFCGYTMSIVQFSGALLPLVHVPWIVCGWLGWSATRERRFAVATIVAATLLMLAGHPLLVSTSLLTVAVTIAGLASGARRLRETLWPVMFVLLAAPLAGFALVPGFVGLSEAWSYKVSSAAGLAYRPIGDAKFWDSLASMLSFERYDWDKLDGGSIAYYLGPLVAALACAGLASAMSRRRAWVVVALVVVGLLLSTPPDGVAAVASATPLAYFKPWYLMFPFAFGVAMAVSLACESLLGRTPARVQPIVLSALLAAIVLTMSPAIADGLAPSDIRLVRHPLLDRLRAEREPYRVVGLRGQTHLPNSGAVTGIEDVRFSSPLLPARYREWFRIAAPDAVKESFPTTVIPRSVDSPWFGAFNVRYVLRSRVPGDEVQTFLPRAGEAPSRGYSLDSVPDRATHPEVMALQSVALHENRRDLHPRAHFAAAAIVVAPGIDAARRAMRNARGSEVEVLEASGIVDPQELGTMTPPVAGDEVRVRYLSTRRVALTTRAAGPRILVLHDAWDAGWRATIDGAPARMFPVSLISRGLMVPGGAHRVEMSYSPPGFRVGVALSLIAVAAAVWFVARYGHARGEGAA